MAASAWALFHGAKEYIADGTIDLDSDTFKCILLASSWTPSLSADDAYADISANELSTANGYTAGGFTCTNVTWVNSSGTMTFDMDDPTWTASGGAITARYAAIFSDTSTGDKLLCYSLLDQTPADVSAADGTAFVVQINASGVFQLA